MEAEQSEYTFDKDISGNQWCSNLNELSNIDALISEQEIFTSLMETQPMKIAIDFHEV